MSYWCIRYETANGPDVVGPLQSKAFAEKRRRQLLATGEVASVEILPMRAWYEVREQLGIDLSRAARTNKEYRKDRRVNGVRLLDITGTHRRLQALVALGWSLPRLEEAGGFRPWALRDVMKKRRVTRETAERVDALYREYRDRLPAPATTFEKQSVARSLTTAKRNGWLPPKAWDDDNIDDPDAISLEADPLTLTQEQRLKLVEQLVSYGSTIRSAASKRGSVRRPSGSTERKSDARHENYPVPQDGEAVVPERDRREDRARRPTGEGQGGEEVLPV
jgi:hypothetical protein